MAPTFYQQLDITQTVNMSNIICASNASDVTITDSMLSWENKCFHSNCETQKKTETKKQKIQRIAKEKMKASWKTYNQKKQNIIEIKQVCKPKYHKFIKY